MKLLGFNISREKAAPSQAIPSVLQPPLYTHEAYRFNFGYSGGLIHEPYAGAWQQNVVQSECDILWHTVVYACVTRIQSDIGKLRIKLVKSDDGVIWVETENSSWSPVLRKQNRYQTHIDFKEQWIGSKLVHGNTYILKERDGSNIVRKLYILDPTRCHPLVAPDGEVFYQLATDNLSGIEESSVVVPASEVIHDRYKPLYHPLVGISPLRACCLAASQALNIQQGASQFFANGSRPGGVLTAPSAINQDVVDKLKSQWEAGYGGANQGRIAVLGNGLKYEPFQVDAHDAQLAEQLKITGDQICTAFGIPAFVVGVGPLPPNTSPEMLLQIYYDLCLQNLIEHMEVLLDEGLELPKPYGTELDLDNLLRMDQRALIDAEAAAVGGALKSTNEGRRRLGLGPTAGGNDVRSQQQYYSLEALAERDADKPFSKPTPATPAPDAAPADNEDPPEDQPEDQPADEEDDQEAKTAAYAAICLTKELAALTSTG